MYPHLSPSRLPHPRQPCRHRTTRLAIRSVVQPITAEQQFLGQRGEATPVLDRLTEVVQGSRLCVECRLCVVRLVSIWSEGEALVGSTVAEQHAIHIIAPETIS